jgi:hypothetical protein
VVHVRPIALVLLAVAGARKKRSQIVPLAAGLELVVLHSVPLRHQPAFRRIQLAEHRAAGLTQATLRLRHLARPSKLLNELRKAQRNYFFLFASFQLTGLSCWVL